MFKFCPKFQTIFGKKKHQILYRQKSPFPVAKNCFFFLSVIKIQNEKRFRNGFCENKNKNIEVGKLQKPWFYRAFKGFWVREFQLLEPVLGTLKIKGLRSFVAPFSFPLFLIALKIALFNYYCRANNQQSWYMLILNV